MTERDQVQEMLGRYVRATDARDGAAMAKLFTADARVSIFTGHGEAALKLGELHGADAIGHAVGAMMQSHPRGGWSHHTTHDHLVTLDGDRATLDAQFVMFASRPDARPIGAQGTVTPMEAGYYRAELRRVDGRWLFTRLRIDHDLAMVFPTPAA